MAILDLLKRAKKKIDETIPDLNIRQKAEQAVKKVGEGANVAGKFLFEQPTIQNVYQRKLDAQLAEQAFNESQKLNELAYKQQDTERRKRLLDIAEQVKKPYIGQIGKEKNLKPLEVAKGAGEAVLTVAPFIPGGGAVSTGVKATTTAGKLAQGATKGIKLATGTGQFGNLVTDIGTKGVLPAITRSLGRNVVSGTTQAGISAIPTPETKDMTAGDRAKQFAKQAAINTLAGTALEGGLGAGVKLAEKGIQKATPVISKIVKGVATNLQEPKFQPGFASTKPKIGIQNKTPKTKAPTKEIENMWNNTPEDVWTKYINSVSDVAPAQAVSPEIGDDFVPQYIPTKPGKAPSFKKWLEIQSGWVDSTKNPDLARYRSSFETYDPELKPQEIKKILKNWDTFDKDSIDSFEIKENEGIWWVEEKVFMMSEDDWGEYTISNYFDKKTDKEFGKLIGETFDTKEKAKARLKELLEFKNNNKTVWDKAKKEIGKENKNEMLEGLREDYENNLDKIIADNEQLRTKIQVEAGQSQLKFNKIPVEDVELELNQIKATLQNEGFKTEPEKVAYTPNIDKVDEKLAKGETPTPEEFDAKKTPTTPETLTQAVSPEVKAPKLTEPIVKLKIKPKTEPTIKLQSKAITPKELAQEAIINVKPIETTPKIETPVIEPKTPEIKQKELVQTFNTNIDPNDPFGNKNPVIKLWNEAISFIDQDKPLLNTLKKIEKETGQTGLKDKFYIAADRVKKAEQIASSKVRNDVDFNNAFRGLNDKDYNAFNEYSKARAELMNYSPEMKTSKSRNELARIVNEGDAQFADRYNSLNKYYLNLAKYANENNIVSSQRLNEYMQNPDYIRIQREMEDALGVQRSASGSRSLKSTTTAQKRTGSEREIKDIGNTAIERAYQIEKEVQKNIAAKSIIDPLQSVGLATPLRTAENVLLRKEMYKFLSESKEGANIINRTVSKLSKQSRILQTELKNLIKESENQGNKDIKKILLEKYGRGTAKKRIMGEYKFGIPLEQIVRDYIADPSTDMKRIIGKVATRNKKLFNLIPQLDEAKNKASLIAQLRSKAYLNAKNAADKSSKNLATIGRFVQGEKELYAVAPEISKIVDNLGVKDDNIIKQIFNLQMRLFRLGTTAAQPVYTAPAYIMDQFGSFIQSKNAWATHNPVNIIRGLKESLSNTLLGKQSDAWKRFEQSGASQTIYDDLRNERVSKNLLNEIRFGQKGRLKNAINPKNTLRNIEELVSIGERAIRSQNFEPIYKKAIKDGLSKQDAIDLAYLNSAKSSVNFARTSAMLLTLGLLYPYFGASVQGSRQIFDSLKENPLNTAMKGFLTVALPDMALTLYNNSDEEKRKTYNSINDYEKENNFIFITDNAYQNDKGEWEGVIKIPKPPGYRDLWRPMSDLTENFVKGESVNTVGGMLNDILSAFTGPIDIKSKQKFLNSIVPIQIKTPLELKLNEDLYTGKKIVPDYMVEQTSEPGKRAYDYTSGTAKLLGEKFGISPIQLERLPKSYLGTAGPQLVNIVDTALANAGVISKDEIGGKSIIEGITGRFSRPKGEKLEEKKTPGEKYYESVKQATKDLSAQDKKAWDTLNPVKTNFLGEDIFDENKRIEKYIKAGIYAQYPNVLEAARKLNQIQVEKGQPSNPLFELPEPLLQKVLKKEALPPGAKDPELSKLYQEEWYQDYLNKRSQYYEQIKANMKAQGKEMPPQKNPYPTTPPQLQKVMDYYSSLPKGTGARSNWIKSNPGLWQQMTAQWGQIDAWENKERVSIGLSEIVPEDTTSKYGKSGGKVKKLKLPAVPKPKGALRLVGYKSEPGIKAIKLQRKAIQPVIKLAPSRKVQPKKLTTKKIRIQYNKR